MSEFPFVSVIVPTHARKTLLLRLLTSLRRQDYPSQRYEIIVVHNWTDDGTEEAVAKAISEAAHPRILYHRRYQYRGPTASRQIGADRAQGDILAFVDDDCEAMPHWLTAGAAAMTPGVGLVQGQTLPRPDQPRRYFEKTVCVTGPTFWFETCNIFYLRQAFQQVGGFSEEFRHEYYGGEDTDLGLKVMQAGWERRFSATALLHHEVFAQSLWAWHRDVMFLRIWPLLVKKWPAMRKQLFCGYFLSAPSAGFVVALLGVLAAVTYHWVGLILIVPYFIAKLFDNGRFRNPIVALARIIVGLPRAMLIFLVLVYGSIKYRSLVL